MCQGFEKSAHLVPPQPTLNDKFLQIYMYLEEFNPAFKRKESNWKNLTQRSRGRNQKLFSHNNSGFRSITSSISELAVVIAVRHCSIASKQIKTLTNNFVDCIVVFKGNKSETSLFLCFSVFQHLKINNMRRLYKKLVKR